MECVRKCPSRTTTHSFINRMHCGRNSAVAQYMFVSQGGTLNDKELQKINLSVDAGLNESYNRQRSIKTYVENEEPIICVIIQYA